MSLIEQVASSTKVDAVSHSRGGATAAMLTMSGRDVVQLAASSSASDSRMLRGRRSSSLTILSLAERRFRIVLRRTMNSCWEALDTSPMVNL